MIDDSYSGRFFLRPDGLPRLWPCVVLFLDLLGVREMARSHDAEDELRRIDRAVRRSARDFLSDDSPFPSALFSDSFVLAYPIDDDAAGYDPVGELVAQAAELQWALTSADIFVRGGIAIGPLHLHRGMLFGQGLVEAYELESTTALHPRIVVSDDVVARGGGLPYDTLRDDDGVGFLDYMRSCVFNYVIASTDSSLAEHRDLITARLERHRGAQTVWDKYRWAAEYHDDVCERLAADRVDLRVSVQAQRRGFSAAPVGSG